MYGNPGNAKAPVTLHSQGHLFGEIVADLTANGLSTTEILTGILNEGPMNLTDAIAYGRALQSRKPVSV